MKPQKPTIRPAKFQKRRSFQLRPRQKTTVRPILHSSVPPAHGSHLVEMHAIESKLKGVLKNHPQLTSVYIYGGLGTKRVHEGSDLDLFIILKDHQDPVKLINSLVSEVKNLGIGRRLDFDICFESEARHFLHRGSAQYQYLTIGRVGRLVYGRPILKRTSFSMKQFYLTVATMSQKIRHEVVNQFGEYAAEHFRKDILFKCGALAYEDPPRLRFHPSENLDYVLEKYPSLGRLRKIITSKESTLEELWLVAETLRGIVERKVKTH